MARTMVAPLERGPAAGIWRRLVDRIRAGLTVGRIRSADPRLEALVIRRDERLLADAGLRLDDAMGGWRHFRERELDPVLGSQRLRR